MVRTNGDGAVSRAAENALLRLGSRVMMLVGVPIILAVAGFGGNHFIQALDANTQASSELKTETVKLRGELTNLRDQQAHDVKFLNNRIDGHADRLKGLDDRNMQQDQRIDRQDFRIEQLLERVRVRSVDPPPPAVPSAPSLQVYPPPGPR